MHYTDPSFTDFAECLLTLQDVETALNEMASNIANDYAEKKPLVIAVMNGALITAGQLLTKINLATDIDYCHATRYGDKTLGGELNWIAYPQQSLAGRNVLLVDDIFDEGITLKLVAEYCKQQGAADVKSAVLLNKIHNRKVSEFTIDYVGLMIPDRYVFGFGLDYKGAFRNAPGIFALK